MPLVMAPTKSVVGYRSLRRIAAAQLADALMISESHPRCYRTPRSLHVRVSGLGSCWATRTPRWGE